MRTQPIPTLATAGLLATLAMPCEAQADPAPLAPNGIPVDPNRSVSGRFDAAGTQTWRLYLRQGRYYAVWGSPTGNADPVASVQAAGGGGLARFQIGLESGGHGASFRAPYTGLYTVAIACDAGCYFPPAGYTLSAGRDCPGDRSTPCGIAPGATLHGLQSRFIEDDDWIGTRLAAGHHYRLNATIESNPNHQTMLLAVRDGRGVLLASDRDQGAAGRFLDFTAPASGLYYVEVAPSGGDAVDTYSLSLSR